MLIEEVYKTLKVILKSYRNSKILNEHHQESLSVFQGVPPRFSLHVWYQVWSSCCASVIGVIVINHVTPINHLTPVMPLYAPFLSVYFL